MWTSSLFIACFSLILGVCYSRSATLVLVNDAVGKGAVCLDGSAPGYYIRKGSGESESKWILHLEGGGWCGDENNCLERSKTALGSSTFWPPTANFNGFLSDNATTNPDFYNWNVAFLMYCDGASFSGDRVDPVDVLGSNIYMRGKPVLNALLDNLLVNGLDKSTEVILTGCSAGGLATYLHADYVGAYLPQNIKYRAFSDAGYFLDIADVHGTMAFRKNITYGIYMQNVTVGLDQNCINNYDCANEWRCFFAPYMFPFIKTPIFVANSLYDTAQLLGLDGLGCLPPNCTGDDLKYFNHFGEQFMEQLAPALNSQSTGIFADSCLVHCQTLTDDTWTQFMIKGQSMRDTFSDWYFDRSSGLKKEVDCLDFPFNPTCPVAKPTSLNGSLYL